MTLTQLCHCATDSDLKLESDNFSDSSESDFNITVAFDSQASFDSEDIANRCEFDNAMVI